VKTDLAELKADFHDHRIESQAEHKAIRAEMQAEFEEIHAEIHDMASRVIYRDEFEVLKHKVERLEAKLAAV